MVTRANPKVLKVKKQAEKPTPRQSPKPAPRKAAPAKAQATDKVLKELKSLAKELNQAAKGLGKKKGDDPKEVSAILGNVERMLAEAATKSLEEAESCKQLVAEVTASLSKDWSRQHIEGSLKRLSGHLTNIMVAQEFQDLAGQSLRKAMKALVGAIILVEGGGPTEDKRLSQNEVDSLLKSLM